MYAEKRVEHRKSLNCLALIQRLTTSKNLHTLNTNKKQASTRFPQVNENTVETPRAREISDRKVIAGDFVGR